MHQSYHRFQLVQLKWLNQSFFSSAKTWDGIVMWGMQSFKIWWMQWSFLHLHFFHFLHLFIWRKLFHASTLFSIETYICCSIQSAQKTKSKQFNPFLCVLRFFFFISLHFYSIFDITRSQYIAMLIGSQCIESWPLYRIARFLPIFSSSVQWDAPTPWWIAVSRVWRWRWSRLGPQRRDVASAGSRPPTRSWCWTLRGDRGQTHCLHFTPMPAGAAFKSWHYTENATARLYLCHYYWRTSQN